jgi:hypothetical protein
LEVHHGARLKPHLATGSSNTSAQINVAELSEFVIEATDRTNGRDIAHDAMRLPKVNGGRGQDTALAIGHSTETRLFVEIVDPAAPVQVLQIACGVYSFWCLEDERHHDRRSALTAQPFATPMKPSRVGDEVGVEQRHRRRGDTLEHHVP